MEIIYIYPSSAVKENLFTDTVHLVNIFRLLKILVKVLQNVSHTFLTPLR